MNDSIPSEWKGLLLEQKKREIGETIAIKYGELKLWPNVYIEERAFIYTHFLSNPMPGQPATAISGKNNIKAAKDIRHFRISDSIIESFKNKKDLKGFKYNK